MDCLGIDKIYLYLENQLSPEEEQAILKHIAGCGKCREALEERKIFQQAAETLPQWQVPPGFTEKVVQSALKFQISLKEIIPSFFIGIFMISSLAFFLIISKGTSLSNMLTHVFRSLLSSIENISIFLSKAAKIAWIFLSLSLDFAVWSISRLKHILSIFSPEILAFLCISSLLTVILASFFLKKKFALGER